MAASTLSQNAFAIDTRSFKEMATKLRKTNKVANRQYRRAMIEAGALVKEKAKKNIEPYSKSIPPTIKVRLTGAQLEVRGGSKNVPIGALFELGNTGKRRSVLPGFAGGEFRHPVYGNRAVWVKQDMHPYLYRAYMETRVPTEKLVQRALADSFKLSGIEIT